MNKVKIIAVVVLLAVVGIWLFSDGDGTEEADDGSESTSTATYFRDHDDELIGQTVDYYTENADVSGYLATPDDASADNQRPAIILIHEWWGLDDDIRQMADDYAAEGYVALAVDMYGAEPTSNSTVAQQRSGAVRENMEEAMNNLSAAVTYLEGRDDVDDTKLATVGWCFGGGWAYQMAINDLGVDASVMYYGQFNPEDDFQMMRASILGHFGEEDSVIDIDNAREFQARLENADQSSAVYIYPNVGHSFANYQGGDNLSYDPESAEQAWNRTLNFLSERLELNDSEMSETEENAAPMSNEEEVASVTTVTYTDAGFQPESVSIAVGETVEFINESGEAMWVASDVHPSHSQYDGTSLSEHCDGGVVTAFDQCGSGDSYTFTFDQAGEWSYHNHESASDGGVVTVN